MTKMMKGLQRRRRERPSGTPKLMDAAGGDLAPGSDTRDLSNNWLTITWRCHKVCVLRAHLETFSTTLSSMRATKKERAKRGRKLVRCWKQCGQSCNERCEPVRGNACCKIVGEPVRFLSTFFKLCFLTLHWMFWFTLVVSGFALWMGLSIIISLWSCNISVK